MDVLVSFRLLDHDGPVGIEPGGGRLVASSSAALAGTALKAGGLIRTLGTHPFGTSTGSDGSTSLLFDRFFGPKALSLQEVENEAAVRRLRIRRDTIARPLIT